MAKWNWKRWLAIAVIGPVMMVCAASRGQGKADAKDGKGENPFDAPPAPAAASGLQREYARLAQDLNSDDTFRRSEAATTLLKVRPGDIPNKETRTLIARGYKSLAEDSRGSDQETAIRGLVVWGGKYSVPIIIGMMEKEGRHPPDECFNALAQLKDPRGAEAVARYLGDFFTHDKAVASLRRMGTAAETALIAAAPSNDEKASTAAVVLLGDVGGEKSLAILTKASNARNVQVKQAARDAIAKIRKRQKSGESPDAKAAEDPNSPFAGEGPAVDIRNRGSRGFGRASDDEEVADVYEGDWGEVKILSPGEPATTGAPADPSREAFDPKWKPAPMRLGKTTSQHEQPSQVTVAGGNSPVAVVLHTDPFAKTLARLEYLNLRKRDASKSSNIVGGATSIQLSPGATRLLMVTKDASQNDTARLDVFGFTNGQAAEQTTWWPFATSRDHGAGEIRWSAWVDEDQLLTLNGTGTLVLWRLDGKKAKAVYQLDVNAGASPRLSPGRGQFALASGRGAELYRVADGELLAQFGEPASGGPSARMMRYYWGGGAVAFNQSGNRLASINNGNVSIWNTTNGKLERDFYCNNLTDSSADFLDDSHLLVNGTDIVDLDRRLIAWRYVTPLLTSTSYGGWRWLVLRRGNSTGIAPVQLLQPEVLEAANELDADDVLALKPGAKVALDIQLGGEDQAKAETALKAEIERNGMEVVSDSPIRITAQVVTGNTETKEYGRGFFNQEDRESVTTTERRYEVEVKVDNEPVYKQVSHIQSAGGPGFVSLKEGQSAQQAIDEQNAKQAANFNFGVTLPRYVVKPKYAGPLGTSQVSFGKR
jgi:hypothetical protein